MDDRDPGEAHGAISDDALPPAFDVAGPEQPDTHPNTPSRLVVAAALAGLAFTGILGGVIGWGIVDTICAEDPTLLQRLLSDADGYRTRVPSCDPYRLGGSISGAVVAAIGAAVVIVLLLRSMSEWRPHHPAVWGGQPAKTRRRKPSA